MLSINICAFSQQSCAIDIVTDLFNLLRCYQSISSESMAVLQPARARELCYRFRMDLDTCVSKNDPTVKIEDAGPAEWCRHREKLKGQIHDCI